MECLLSNLSHASATPRITLKKRAREIRDEKDEQEDEELMRDVFFLLADDDENES